MAAHPPVRNEVSTPMPSLTSSSPMPPAAHQPAAHQPVQAPAAHQPPPPPQFSMPAPPQAPTPPTIGQENIVRVFDELMKNIARMKMFVRPSMCKPYGKQSESLQKSELRCKSLSKSAKKRKIDFLLASIPISFDGHHSNRTVTEKLYPGTGHPNQHVEK